MRIGIVGGGAVGLLTAAYFCGDHDVTIYTRRNEQAEKLCTHGLTVICGNERTTHRVHAEPFVREIEEEMLFIAVKQYDLANILQTRIHMLQANAIMFLQNGMGHVSYLPHVPHHHIALAVVEHGALKIDDTTVSHTGVGQTKWSVWRGEKEAFSFLSSTNNRFPFQYVDDWEAMLLEKLMVNVAINPLTALLRVPNGMLVTHEPYRQAMKQLFQEVASVFQLEQRERIWKHIETVCRQTAANRSSMLRDIESGRKTELDAILRYVIERANERGVPAPISTFLYALVKGKQLEGEKER
ncbi:2-dehydropantoate 2-reductase [Anoxybacillus ayderensis]|uniref:2-dehydropantoate 2-reductase n=1 Tax=Anoxybacillus ayderensis TaxID=265546 RepID=A0A0D0H316_9BACL|nr:2-dehydropantoate 2-reductase [Anoxybacillus ayderensis]NNU95209.1 2-dehydropantoate 2-reductase [Anoxybacillus sp. EFIL]EPZ38503.1 2-dehydropantoate 2-reductase [Anoxybacillus ayderensis]KIP22441.1 putative 2-dehydropantoate 2-reductase [Anoxybacillus ayderensis]MBA2878798.1 2-dehydropantoate 2-reductase [Anoxybacillus ayderensis]MED0656626.1 2-dehydropantoate 2-reductase [Anoxybacillus ayderensis]